MPVRSTAVFRPFVRPTQIENGHADSQRIYCGKYGIRHVRHQHGKLLKLENKWFPHGERWRTLVPRWMCALLDFDLFVRRKNVRMQPTKILQFRAKRKTEWRFKQSQSACTNLSETVTACSKLHRMQKWKTLKVKDNNAKARAATATSFILNYHGSKFFNVSDFIAGATCLCVRLPLSELLHENWSA